MSNIDKQALRDSAERTINILENIAGFEPSDIDGDTVELRFETEDGFDTGCDVSIVDQCQKAADLVRALLDELEAEQRISSTWRKTAESNREKLEAAEKRVAELEESHSKLRESMAAIHNTISRDGAHTSLALILNAAKRAHAESADAAASRINGEG
ncbi:ead/Ea22-like family protein [Enterobacter asburiae]|uniref:ead/Ea22-like family protein n=1 Tax=Enterobacter asburiae TaxID=61645 RepID=UPI002879B4D5|nr:ead/Ea22-like family protein [Enterobacter asburiae]MDS1916091.1 ead/Ea22-like family protein [Enterobacter asburiae]